MHELINFSVYPVDIGHFHDDWSAVAAFVHSQGVDGLELLIGETPPPVAEIPPGLITAVHLPFWISWLAGWQGHSPLLPTDEHALLAQRLYGGQCAADLVALLRKHWQHAALLHPAYMVFHVCHVELADTFTRAYSYTDAEVCMAAADLLNATAAMFPDGEPPVRLFLENLWWPGLTFTNPDAVAALVERLQFSNWAFVLDTGHLMNNNPTLEDEVQGIEYVLETVAQLPPAICARIEGVHLHTSLSGAYQQQALRRGLPDTFDQMTLWEQYGLVHQHVSQIDLHQPFTHSRCAEMIAALQPQFVTHEFIGRDAFEKKVATQRAALHPNKEHTT